MKRIKILLVALLATGVSAFAAPNSLYFMDILPFQSYQNPALRPLSDTYVELPGISNVSASFGTGGLSLNDLFYVKEGQLVSFLHPEYGNKDALFAKLRNNSYVTADADVSMLGFGWATGDNGYFTFNTSVRADAMLCAPKDFASLLLYGTPDEEGVNRYNFSSLRLNAHAYIDVAGGYSHRINDQWTVGGRLHLLVGAAAGEVSFEELSLEASKEEWKLSGNGRVNLSVPGVYFIPGSDGGIGELLVTDIEDILSFYKPSLGAAIDLGATYKPIPELTLSMSLKDIGFMYWNNLTSASGDIEGSFTGIYYDINNPINVVDSLLASVKGSLNVDNTTGGYIQEMRGKLYVGAEYSFLRNMMSVGVLSKTEFMSKYVSEEVSLNYKIRPCHWFGISAGYSFVSGGWSTIGFGMDIKLPPFNFYVATDYTPLYYSAAGIPYKSQAINVQAGVVLTFKTRDNAKRLTAKAADLAAIPEVTAEEPMAEPQSVPESQAVPDPQAVPELVEGPAATEPAEVETSVSNTTVTETLTEKVEEVQGDEVGGTNVVKL